MMTEERSIDPVNLERRKHPRFLIDWPAEYWPVNISQARPGRTGDISEGGVMLYLREKLSVGQNIGVKIFISPGLETRSIEALGQPVWNDSHFGKKDFYHRIGVKFVSLSAENRDELKNVLNAQMNLATLSSANLSPRLLSPLEVPVMSKKDGQPVSGEPVREERRDLIEEPKEETFLDSPDDQEEEATKLPRELIQDFQETYTEEQRQNLYERIFDMSVPERFRLAVFANREARSLLIRDPNKMIALNVLKNVKVMEHEVLGYAQRRDLSQDIILAIAQDPKWKKSYSIRLAIVWNPKTPLALAINFLAHLYEKDLDLLSREKNVSSILRRRAQEILHKKK